MCAKFKWCGNHTCLAQTGTISFDGLRVNDRTYAWISLHVHLSDLGVSGVFARSVDSSLVCTAGCMSTCCSWVDIVVFFSLPGKLDVLFLLPGQTTSLEMRINALALQLSLLTQCSSPLQASQRLTRALKASNLQKERKWNAHNSPVYLLVIRGQEQTSRNDVCKRRSREALYICACARCVYCLCSLLNFICH